MPQTSTLSMEAAQLRRAVYMDNAATSHPKPAQVLEAVRACLDQSLTVQRSTHVAPFRGDEVLRRCRSRMARFIGASAPEEIIYAYSATDALNIALHGMLQPGGHLIVSPLEHHSVMRPLHHLRESLGISWSVLPADAEGFLDPDVLRGLVQAGAPDGSGRTCAVVLNWISNVSGTVQPAAQIGKLCRELEIPYLVDASQATGSHVVDVEVLQCDAMAQPAHKALMSLPGLGILYVREGFDFHPWRIGGTGYRSDLVTQPLERPMRYEAGTPNVPAIVGLDSALDWFEQVGIGRVEEHYRWAVLELARGIASLPGLRMIGPCASECRADRGRPLGSCLSFTLDAADGSVVEPGMFSITLAEWFRISSRAGLHCAPTAHRHFGTYERGGTVRLSPGYFTTQEDITAVIEAVREVAGVLGGYG